MRYTHINHPVLACVYTCSTRRLRRRWRPAMMTFKLAYLEIFNITATVCVCARARERAHARRVRVSTHGRVAGVACGRAGTATLTAHTQTHARVDHVILNISRINLRSVCTRSHAVDSRRWPRVQPNRKRKYSRGRIRDLNQIVCAFGAGQVEI